MTSIIGQTIGNYRIDTLLGIGGMGEVYHGIHEHLGRPAAIKIMHPHLASDSGFQARFRQEARAAANLTHSGIVQIYDFGYQDQRYYLVMELVRHGSVRTLLRQHVRDGTTLDLRLGLNLVGQAADALAYAHRNGMIHRDIKPDNLLLRDPHDGSREQRDYQVKICDFGLARLAEGSVLTASGVMMGTPAYMSPEQCQGLPLDGRSDLYSLGIVLYQVATGRLPFDVKTPTDAAFKHVFTPPPAPREIAPHLPGELEAIILRCLAKQPDERYASMDELTAALRSGSGMVDPPDMPTRPIATLPIAVPTPVPDVPPQSESTSAPVVHEPAAVATDLPLSVVHTHSAPSSATTMPPPRRPAARRMLTATWARLPWLPAWAAALAIVILSAVGAGAAVFWPGDGEPEGGQPAVSAADADSQEPGTITFAMGEQVFRMAAEDGASPENVSAALEGLSPGVDDGWLNMSPDGNWLLLETSRFNTDCAGYACLALVPSNLSSGEIVLVNGEPLHPGGFSAVASGGELIVFPGRDGPHEQDLYATVRRDGQWAAPRLLTGDSPFTYHAHPALSDDGSRIVFQCGPQSYEDTSICEVSTDGSGFRTVLTPDAGALGLPAGSALLHPDYRPDGAIVFEVSGNGEQIWYIAQPDADPAQLVVDLDQAHTPCVLPDGRIVVVWIDWLETGSTQEIKIAAPDGASYEVILSTSDIVDPNVGCGA